MGRREFPAGAKVLVQRLGRPVMSTSALPWAVTKSRGVRFRSAAVSDGVNGICDVGSKPFRLCLCNCSHGVKFDWHIVGNSVQSTWYLAALCGSRVRCFRAGEKPSHVLGSCRLAATGTTTTAWNHEGDACIYAYTEPGASMKTAITMPLGDLLRESRSATLTVNRHLQ